MLALFVVGILALAVWILRFEYLSAEEGRYYQVNRITGHVLYIGGGRARSVELLPNTKTNNDPAIQK